ncbi:hypothetical protein KZZ52_33155 [Dactylosporangium sp. AC04546]|uniref:hypothetical protein n=1 Tax=Dactylosporangium sp. AC04546 TaxID=2862460 RepID=UPI001EDE4277|nr:hypothetical protein [Dactylosporangium sp. AC04546]WVK78833.1 hypothetical protein KZZ52_33155 [Dactylosporangium sp. AC04546]
MGQTKLLAVGNAHQRRQIVNRVMPERRRSIGRLAGTSGMLVLVLRQSDDGVEIIGRALPVAVPTRRTAAHQAGQREAPPVDVQWVTVADAVLGDAGTHDRLVREIAVLVGAAVVLVA